MSGGPPLIPVMSRERPGHPTGVNTDNHDKELEVEKQPDRLKHLDDSLTGTPIEIVDVKHDAVDAKPLPRDAALSI